VAFVPQLVQVVRSRSAHDISTSMFLIFCAGLVLWLFYGLLLGSKPIIIANAVTLVLAGTILGLKLHYERLEALRSGKSGHDRNKN
jgi:MtN3 and saliva related transmembrane protein